MVTINKDNCIKCGVCIERFGGFCINGTEGMPVIDYMICNQCQKCIAICPSMAIMMNSKPPKKITGPLKIDADSLTDMLQRRRSIKKFKDKCIPRDILRKIAQSAAFAPNQNKNIEIIIVDDKKLIDKIDKDALQFWTAIYKILFSFKLMTGFFKLFSKSIMVIRKKMERDIFTSKHIVKPHTAALFLAVGNPGAAVTEESAQYLLANMIFYSEAAGIGNTLMDSLKISVNNRKRLKKLLGIKGNMKVLGVLAAGYSDENILNIPNGYEIKLQWNDGLETGK